MKYSFLSYGLIACSLIGSLSAYAAPSVATAKANEIIKKIEAHVIDHTRKVKEHKNDYDQSNAHCNYDELQFLEIEKQVLSPLKSFVLGKGSIIPLTDSFSGEVFPFKVGEKKKEFKGEGISLFQLKNTKALNSNVFLNQLSSFLADKKIEFFSLDTKLIYSNIDMREKKSFVLGQPRFKNSLNMLSADLKIKFDLRFVDVKAKKSNDRGELRLQVVRENISSAWKIQKIELLDGTRLVANSSPIFKEITQTSFKDPVPAYLRREAIRRGGYATSIGDFNNDGIQDIFFGSEQSSHLYKGDSLGHFTEVKDTGLEGHSLVKSAAFVDLYNTGKQDLVLIRFNPSLTFTPGEDLSDIIVYKNVGEGKFTKVKSPILFHNKHDYAMPMALGDFNKDGLIDLYIGFPGAKDFTTMKEKVVAAKDLQKHGFFFNQGLAPMNFVEKDSVASAVENTFSDKYDSLDFYPHSANAVDFNLDGILDIVTIDDRARISPAFMGMGDGKFKQVNNDIGFSVRDYGMGMALGDIFSNGKLDIVMTSVNFIAAERINNSCKLNWSFDFSSVAGDKGLRFFRNDSGYFNEVSDQIGLDYAGEGLAGVELIDYNNDGNLDIFVSNGLWTGSGSTAPDLSSLVVRASSLGLFEEDFKVNGKESSNFLAPVGQNIAFADNDNGFLVDAYKSRSAIVEALSFAKTEDGKSYSFAGNQRKRVFRNNGDGSFTEVGYALGVDSQADGYMIGYSDLDKDGRLDLVYRNADPGVDVNQFSPLQIYKNQSKLNHSVILTFAGSGKSNRDAIGTIVKATVGKKTFVRQLSAMNGTIQSQKLVHVGVGSHRKIDSLEIRWPDGFIQVLKNVKEGHHHLVEPLREMKSASLN